MEGLDLDLLRALVADLRGALTAWAVAGARALGLVLVMPVFRRAELGRVVKLGVAYALALPAAPAMAAARPDLAGAAPPVLALAGMGEFAVGATLGLIAGVPFWAAQAVGAIVDVQRTVGEGGIDDPSTGEQVSAFSNLTGFVAVALFAASGGIGLLLAALWESYAVWPPGAGLPSAPGALTGLLSRLLLSGLLLAGPFVAAFLLTDVAVMALGRLAGRIDTASLLPLVKNLLFCVLALVYLEALAGHVARGLAEGAPLETLADFLGEADLP